MTNNWINPRIKKKHFFINEFQGCSMFNVHLQMYQIYTLRRGISHAIQKYLWFLVTLGYTKLEFFYSFKSPYMSPLAYLG